MSLLDDLREIAKTIDSQFLPSTNEVQGILGAIVHYAEHGDALLTAAEAGVEDVTKLLEPKTETEAAQPPAPAATAAPAPEVPAQAPAPAAATDDELAAQIADLQAQQAARRATAQQTTVEHETGAPAGVTAAGLKGLFGRGG